MTSRYKTAGQIINAAAKELGIGTAVDPFSSASVDFQQLVQMLNSVGLDLADAIDWEHLIREYTFVTVTNQTPYDLPADFMRMVDGTFWDRTSQMRVDGPLSDAEWQARAATPGSTVYVSYRLTTNQILLAPKDTVPGSHTLAFELRSRAWVRAAGTGLGNGNTLGTAAGAQDEAVVIGDYVLFDPLLMQYALKLAWKRDKGFDTTTAESDYLRVLEGAKGRTRAADVLSVAPSRPNLAAPRVPDTGWGT